MTIHEVRQARTLNTKTFKLHGGRYRTLVDTTEALHVENDGRWEDIGLGNYTDSRGAVHYTNIPFLLTVDGSHLQVRGRTAGYSLDVTTRPENATYKVSKYGFKSFIPFSSREAAPRFVEIQIQLAGLTYNQDPAGGLIRFYRHGKLIWRMKRPVLIDANGMTIDLDMNTLSGEKELMIHIAMPDEWLDAEDRVFPVIFDPTYTSSEISVSNGANTYYTVPSDRTYTAGTAKCHWKGVSGVSGTLSEVYNYNAGTGQGSAAAAFPSVPAGGTFYRLKSVHNWTGNYTLNPDPPYNSDPYVFTAGNPWWNDGLTTHDAGTTQRVSTYSYNAAYIGQNASSAQTNYMPSNYCSYNVYAYTYYYPESKTTNPKVTINGSDTQYTGVLNNGTWSSYQTLNGFHDTTQVQFTHTIAGSGSAGFQFYYDWTYSAPTVLKYARIHTSSGNVDIGLVSPSDPALEYDCLRMSLGGTTYCVDLVDTDDPAAGPLRIRTARGTKSAREI